MEAKERLRNIIQIRLFNLGLRQKDLADAINVPVSTLSGWLRLGRDIPAQYIVGIADCLQCPPMYLLTGEITDQTDADSLLSKKQDDDELAARISADGLKVGGMWDGLDEAGKAIILGQIYQRLEALSAADRDPADELPKRTN